jgi:hypothetical protein
METKPETKWFPASESVDLPRNMRLFGNEQYGCAGNEQARFGGRSFPSVSPQPYGHPTSDLDALPGRLRHLKLGTIEKCALREGWKDLRCEFEARQRDKLLPPLPTAPPAPIAPPTPQNELERQLHQLVAHRDRLDAMIAAETDPVKLDRLSSARSRVFEQWRILANVPLPGSRKPQKERRGPGSSLPPPTPVSAEQPSDPEPVPTP